MKDNFIQFVDDFAKASGQCALCEAVKKGYALFEDAASTATHKTKRVIREVLPSFGSMFDDIAKDDNGEPILTSKGKTQTLIEYLERHVKNTYFHDGKSNIKFEPGVARIAYGELGMQMNEDTRKLRILGRILQEISASHSTEYDSNFNGMSYDELNDRFGGAIKQADDRDRDDLKNVSYDKSNYIIKWIPDFETAQQYSRYTDYGSSEHWCLTYNQDMWESYTGQHNENKVYFCYVPDIGTVERVVAENTPLDEYGLSLISVIVTPEHELRAVTCRWNHTNGGSDGVMDVKQLSSLLGGYVFDLCPPYPKEELKERGYIPLDDIQQMLDDGVDFSDYIDKNGIITINYKRNLIKNGKLLSDKWFDWIYAFKEGYAAVLLNEKTNLIDTNGNLLSDKWFDWVGEFYYGYAKVILNGKTNLIDTNGNLLSDKWFDSCDEFHYGHAKVRLNGKVNFIDHNGNLLSDQWFDSCGSFDDEQVIKVCLNGKENFIDTNGNLLYDQWYEYCGGFHDGCATVRLNGKWNFIDPNGNILSDQWFDYCEKFHYGHAAVRLNGKWNFIDTNGNILSDQWFDYCGGFQNGQPSIVRLDGKWNFIDPNGNILSNQWFDYCVGFQYGGPARVRLDDKWNFIDPNGNILSDEWFDYCDVLYDGTARVQLNGKSYQIDGNGTLIER